MPDCTSVIRTLTKSSVPIRLDGGSQSHINDQLMQIDQSM